LVVRHAAPEEEGQAGGQLEIADRIGSVWRDVCRIGLDAEEELGADEQPPDGHLDTALEAGFLACVREEFQQNAELGIRDRTPVRLSRKTAEDLTRALGFCSAGRRPTREDALAARCFAGAVRVERTGDRDARDGRRCPRRSLGMRRQERLSYGLRK